MLQKKKEKNPYKNLMTNIKDWNLNLMKKGKGGKTT